MKEKIDYTKMEKAEKMSLLEEKRQQLRELRFRAAAHELKKVGEIKKIKKEIARILTDLSKNKS